MKNIFYSREVYCDHSTRFFLGRSARFVKIITWIMNSIDENRVQSIVLGVRKYFSIRASPVKHHHSFRTVLVIDCCSPFPLQCTGILCFFPFYFHTGFWIFPLFLLYVLPNAFSTKKWMFLFLTTTTITRILFI